MIESVNLYQYFYAVANTGNISRAAKVMYTSQPVVSKYIARLENELGVQLFKRTPRGVILTEEGSILYEHVKTAFNYLEAGMDALRHQQNVGLGHLRIGVSTTLCKYLLLPYLKQYIAKYPNVRLSIECQSTYHTLEALENNQIDIGLIGQPDHIGGLKFYEMTDIEDIFVASPSYMEHIRQNQSMDDAMSQTSTTAGHLKSGTSSILTSDLTTVMLLDKGNITRQYIDRYMTESHLYPANMLEISTMDLIIEFSKIGMGIGCVIKEFVKDELKQGTLVEIPLHTPLQKRTVGFAVRNDKYMNAPLKYMLEMLKLL
jgi:DNA-binding transcriptional LysR family regulator